MKPFDHNHYYSLITSQNKLKTPPVPQPTAAGVELIIKHLSFKYNANIIHPISYYNSHFEPEYVSSEPDNILSGIDAYLRRARKAPENYRQAYVIYNEGHAILLAYFKEHGKEALFFTDSSQQCMNYDFLKELSKIYRIPVFSNSGIRQADQFSCIMDALVFARDLTGIKANGDYIIPNLIELFETQINRHHYPALYMISLPDILLKTAQRSEFIREHRAHLVWQGIADIPIYKNQTITQFRARYTENTIGEKGPVSYSNYLLKKATKYINTMKIWHYLEEMEAVIGIPLPAEAKKEWTETAKRFLKEDSDDEAFYHFSNQFLNTFLSSTTQVQEAIPAFNDVPEDIDEAQVFAQYFECENEETQELLAQIKECMTLDDNDEIEDAASSLLIPYRDNPDVLVTGAHFLFHTNPTLFPFDFLAEIAEEGQTHADLIINNQHVIQTLATQKKLYYFASKDAYLAENILEKYPLLLTKQERKALSWKACYTISKIIPSLEDSFDDDHEELGFNEPQHFLQETPPAFRSRTTQLSAGFFGDFEENEETKTAVSDLVPNYRKSPR